MWCMSLWQTHCFGDLSYEFHFARRILQWIMEEPSAMQHPAERNTTCNLAIPGWTLYFKFHRCVHTWRLRDFDQHWWCEKIHQEKCESWRWADAHLCSTDTNTLTQSCNADNVFVVTPKKSISSPRMAYCARGSKSWEFGDKNVLQTEVSSQVEDHRN